MPFRFRKSLKIGKGIRVNLSKSGISTSFGKRGASVNLSNRGTRVTTGIPGTGFSFSKLFGKGNKSKTTPLLVNTENHYQQSSKVPSGNPNRTSKKIPFIPMKGGGCLQTFLVLPLIAILNLYIALFAGIWYGGQWLWKTATATQTSRRVSAALVSVLTVCGVISSAVGSFSQNAASSVPTLDLVSVQGTALAEAWKSYTQTVEAMPTNTATLQPTIESTLTSNPTFTPLPTATLIVFPTNTLFVLPAATLAPQSAVCSCSGDSLNCTDFGSWSSAQACYSYCQSQGVGDIHGLDGNNDGSACDSLK